MILLHNVRLPLESCGEDAVEAARRKLRLGSAAAGACSIHKISVDARRKPPRLVYSVALRLESAAREQRVAAPFAGDQSVQLVQPQKQALAPGEHPLPGPVVVCGMGPAGLFAALELARQGYRPLLVERGPDMDTRRRAVEAFAGGGTLDENANIQFGEGGAGTFSDGKLTTRIRDPLCGEVMERLVEAGAPEEILYKANPHIGTDLLQGVLQNLRRRVVELGGWVQYNTALTGLAQSGGALQAIKTSAGDIPCGVLVLAIGHSARDTFETLHHSEIALEAKPFSVGFRIEHLQRDIDQGLYHEAAGHPALPPGEYRLSARAGGRGVYTFCMCPGGSVVAAASEAGGVVTNGMSLHARGGPNANAAVVAGVSPQDFGGGPLAGVAYQRALERAAFEAGGRDYTAPAETLGSFLEGGGTFAPGRVEPSYPRGVRAVSLAGLLGEQTTQTLQEGLRQFAAKLPGFGAPDAVLTGLETRTSSPVRILRDDTMQSGSLAGLYPCGEGAGYAGGIMSAAVDGLRVAAAIVRQYAPAAE